MPVTGNEEPGVLSRQTSIYSAGIPLKKRRFPLIPPPSPPRDEPPPSLPEKNDVKNKEESSSGKEPSLNANVAKDYMDMSNVGKNPLKEVKKETPADCDANSVQTNVELSESRAPVTSPPTHSGAAKETSADIDVNPVQTTPDLSGSRSQEIIPAVNSGSINNVDSEVKPLLKKKSAILIVPRSNLGFPTVNVKKEIISTQAEGDCKLELSAGSGNVELSLGSKERLVSALGCQRNDGSFKMPDKLDPSLLSLSLSKEIPIGENRSRDNSITNPSGHACSNRSKWDLNTTMDAWESSVVEAASHDTGSLDKLNGSSSTYDIKQSLSSISVVGVSIDKGKQVIEPLEKRSNPCLSSMASSQQYSSEDSLHLSLSTSFPQLDFSREHSDSSAKDDSIRGISNLISPRPIINTNSSGCRTVKSEPVHENLKLDTSPVAGSPLGLLGPRLVKREIVHCVEAAKTSTSNSQKLIDSSSVKSEVGHEGNQEMCNDANVILYQSGGKVVQHQESCSSSSTIISMPLTPQQPYPLKLLSCSELSASGGVSDQSEHSIHTKQVHISKDIMDQAVGDMIPKPVSHNSEEPNVVDGKVNTGQAEMSRSKRSDKHKYDLHATADGSVSDEEKINISADMLEEDAYSSDYESDGNHTAVSEMDMEDGQCSKKDDEYEDGEVREPLMHSSAEGPVIEGVETENVKHVDYDTKMGIPGDCNNDQIDVDGEMELHNERSSEHSREYVGAVTDANSDQLIEDHASLQNTLSDKATVVGADERRPENEPIDQSAEKDIRVSNEDELLGDGDTNINRKTVTTVSEAAGEIVKGTNMVGNCDSSLSKAGDPPNGHDTLKDSVTGGNRSRIIHLPRASNLTSPPRIRSISGRPFTSRSGRERYSNIEGENYHHRGNRDDLYADGPNKFRRDRIQERSFRNSRLDFMRGRGRAGRLNTSHTEWDPDHDFASEGFDVPADYRFNRHNRASAIADTGLECNDYVVTPDGTALSAGRGGRNPLTEQFHSFRHPSSRRLSPGARDPRTRNLPVLRRIPRNIGEAGFDLPGLRHEEKLMRGLPDDITDSIYTRPQVSYEELDGQFVRGNRNFSTIQRRGFPRVRLKSPNSRPRSPGPWMSPRRRLTDGFNSPSDQTQHRSPAIYRVDKMRSPDRFCYSEDMGTRRRVSPSVVPCRSNDIRDMDSAREHGRLRSINSNRRSPSDRMFPRSTRRLDVVDPRERADSDGYFAGPIHTGRFHEFHGDGSNDDRKNFGGRRGLVRSFRPSYSGNNESYRFSSEDGSRPFRFCPDQDTESFERSNIRERDFDGGINTQTPSAPRQIRSIEEQEGNYRQTGQVWHDETFNDASRLKRRRF